MTNKTEWVAGRHAVTHLMSAGRRQVKKLFIQKGSDKNSEKNQNDSLLQLARRKNIEVFFESPQFFSKKIPEGHHQGILAEAEPYPYVEFSDLLNHPFLVFLDEIQDPQNLGALCRTAYLMGVGGVVIPETHAASVTSGACQASVGAVEYLPIARVSSIAQALLTIKEHGFWVYGCSHQAEKMIHEEQFSAKVALVIGSEEKGLRRLVQERCDILVKIPMCAQEVDSLNASVAGGIVMYEISRQKNK